MKQARQEAERLVQTYQTRDPFALCEALGIVVLDCPLPRHIRGFYQNYQGCQLIYLNDELESGERRAICAHELGHAILHEEQNFLFMTRHCHYFMSRFEKEADLFAAELLIDPAEICEMNVQAIARQWGLSEEIVRLKYEML